MPQASGESIEAAIEGRGDVTGDASPRAVARPIGARASKRRAAGGCHASATVAAAAGFGEVEHDAVDGVAELARLSPPSG